MSKISDDLRCRGAWCLGNNCGKCPACLETVQDGIAEINRLRGEASALRAGLPRLFDRCENYSAPDVKAVIADVLGETVKKLEKRK